MQLKSYITIKWFIFGTKLQWQHQQQQQQQEHRTHATSVITVGATLS